MTTPLPRLGLGTYRQVDPTVCAESVAGALDAGYRHIDTAQMYDNEVAVGRGIRESQVGREAVFLASKLTPDNLSHEAVIRTTQASLDRLGVDRLDLMYVHWPMNSYEPSETLPALDELVERGLVDAIGVSNFEPPHLERAREILETPILANQVEMHPMLPQTRLLADAREHDYWLVAYSPIARTEIFDAAPIAETAARLGCTPAQLCLAWLLDQDNVAAIPKATGAHIGENLAAKEVSLDEGPRDRLGAIERRHRIVDFGGAPWHDPGATSD